MPTEARTVDPTRTTVLRRQASQNFRTMWRRIQRRVNEYMDAVDFDEPQAVRSLEFARFLNGLLDEEFAQAENDDRRGIRAMVFLAYLRGIQSADRDLGEEFNRYAIYERDHDNTIAALILLYSTRMVDARTRLEAQLLERYAAVDSLTDAKQQTRDRLQKAGRTVTDAIMAALVIRAFNDALLTQYRRRGVQQVGLEDERLFWQTAGDSDVCIRCQSAASVDNGFGPGIYTMGQAAGLIPLHDRCRCRWRPVRPELMRTRVPAWSRLLGGN